MSWDPDAADTPPLPGHVTLSPMAIAVAVGVPLLMLLRVCPHFA